MLLGVTGTSSSQVASMLKEKAAFLQKHDQALFRKDFRDHLTGSLKAKKQSIEAITEVSKSPTGRGPFERAPHFIKEGQMGGKNSDRTTTVNTFCSKRKEPLHSNSQISFPVMINMEDLTHVHPILKKLFSKQKIPKCALAGRIKEFLPAWKLLTRDQELLALVEVYQIPLLMEPVQEKAPKVLKLNKEQQKQVDLEVKAILEKGSISKVCHSKGEFLRSLFLTSKKRWREPTSHKFEGSESVHSLQALQDGRFALPEICVAKRRLHAQNRPEGCILQCSSTQRFTKISTVSLGRKLARVPVPMLWFGISSQNIHKIIKGSNLSLETSYDKGHNLSGRFIDFRKQYERNIYGKGLCDLYVATSRLCNKSEEVCVRSCTGNRVLRVDCEFPNYNFVITSGKDREDKGSMPEVIQGIKGNTSGFDKTNRKTFFNHSSSAPSTSTVSLLTTTANCISETITVLPHFDKADSHGKKRVVIVGQQSRNLQWPIGYTTTGTGPYSDRCIQKRLGGCMSRDQNGGSVVQEGTGSTYQSAGTFSHKICHFDICQNVENVSHTHSGRQHESLELFAENGRDKESRTNADLKGNLGVSAWARDHDYCRIFTRKSQLQGRLGISTSERFLRMETVPSSFQQNMANIED